MSKLTKNKKAALEKLENGKVYTIEQIEKELGYKIKIVGEH